MTHEIIFGEGVGLTVAEAAEIIGGDMRNAHLRTHNGGVVSTRTRRCTARGAVAARTAGC